MSHESVEPGPMPFHELKQITNDFSEERNIGTGAYGSVYMGIYEDGRKVAVKILHSRPGFDEKQFETEFHNIKSLHHQNVVRLIGYCHETSGEFLQHNEKTVLASKINMALCMEYMAKGSLDKHISDEYNGHNWHTRYKIIKGICSGLQYLHEELENPFYHLDLKPDNILLDEEMVPKIGDFGLSRFFADQQTQITSACIGTFGYLPPEYLERKAISSKLDIFSLGVVITKIISGSEGFTKLYTMKSEKFIELVQANWRSRLQKESMSDVEPYLEIVRACTKIALRCLEDDRHTRPTIGEIVNELNEKETIMRFSYALSIDGGSSTDQVSLCTSTQTQSTDAQSSMSESVDSSKKQQDAPEIKESESLKVQPGQLRFPFKPNKLSSRVLYVTNKTSDKKVAFRCVPKVSGVYINDLQHARGVLPPNCTCAFIATTGKRPTPPSNKNLLLIVESCLVDDENIQCCIGDDYLKKASEESGGKFHEVTLMGVYDTAGEPTISKARVTALKIAREGKEPGPFSFLRKNEDRTLEAFSVKFIARKKWLVAGDGFGYIHVHTYEAMLTKSGANAMPMDKVNKFHAHTSAITSLAVHPSKPFVLSASKNKLIKLWDCNTFASVSVDGTLLIWDISSTIPITKMNWDDYQVGYGFDYFSTSDDSQCLITTSRTGSLHFWDLQAESRVKSVPGFRTSFSNRFRVGSVCVVDSLPDHPILATASENSTVLLYDYMSNIYLRMFYFGLGKVQDIAYIKDINSVVIAFEEGLAIMEIKI